MIYKTTSWVDCFSAWGSGYYSSSSYQQSVGLFSQMLAPEAFVGDKHSAMSLLIKGCTLLKDFYEPPNCLFRHKVMFYNKKVFLNCANSPTIWPKKLIFWGDFWWPSDTHRLGLKVSLRLDNTGPIHLTLSKGRKVTQDIVQRHSPQGEKYPKTLSTGRKVDTSQLPLQSYFV